MAKLPRRPYPGGRWPPPRRAAPPRDRRGVRGLHGAPHGGPGLGRATAPKR